LFAGSNRSGEGGSAIYSLVITAKLADVLGRTVDQPAGDLIAGGQELAQVRSAPCSGPRIVENDIPPTVRRRSCRRC
jgi:hypothetical protein